MCHVYTCSLVLSTCIFFVTGSNITWNELTDVIVSPETFFEKKSHFEWDIEPNQ